MIAHNERLNHVLLMTARTSIWTKMKVIMERGDPLFAPRERINSLLKTMKQKSELSLGSTSFLHRVNDQVRKRQKQSSKDATQDNDKHSVIWRMFMSSTMQASVFMEKNYSDNWHSIKNTEDLTMKQMFNISEKLISEQSDEIYGVKTIDWENPSWKYLSLIGDEQITNLSTHNGLRIFRFCIVSWKDTRMQLQFLAPVELFFKQLNGSVFDPGRN